MAQFTPGIINALMTLGLNKKHVTVLGHLYTLGRVRVNEISPDVDGITRTELYSILNHLVEIQLVEKLSVNNATCFELKPNSEIIRWTNKKKLQAEETHRRTSNAAGRVKEFLEEQDRSIEPRPFFHYLEGIKGMETAHKIIMPNSKSIDMYMNYGELSLVYPPYEQLLITMLKDYPETEIRIILTDENTKVISKKLQAESRLFLRSGKKKKNSLLLCIGDRWVIDFAMSGVAVKGFYVHCQNFDCMSVFTETFEKDWAASEELPSCVRQISAGEHY